MSVGLFAVLQEGKFEFLSCDSVEPSLSPIRKTRKSLVRVLPILVSFRSEASRQGPALLCSKIRNYCNQTSQ